MKFSLFLALALMLATAQSTTLRAQTPSAPKTTPSAGTPSAPAPAASAATPEAIQLHEAEKAMTQGNDYAAAISIYEDLLADAPFDPRLLYNLGNAYALEGDEGNAIWAYLRALRSAPRDEDLRHNLSVLSPDYMERLAVTPLPPVDWLYHHFSANEWAAAAGGATTLALLLALAGLRWGRGRAWGRGAMAAVRALAVVACATWPFAILHYHQVENVTIGVVVKPDSFARMGPNARKEVNFALPAGSIVRLGASADPEWLRVIYGADNVGFVERSHVRIL